MTTSGEKKIVALRSHVDQTGVLVILMRLLRGSIREWEPGFQIKPYIIEVDKQDYFDVTYKCVRVSHVIVFC